MSAIFWAAKFCSLAVGRVRVEATALLISSREDVQDDASSILDVDEFPATEGHYIYIENLVIKGLTDLQCREEKEYKLVSIFGPARQESRFCSINHEDHDSLQSKTKLCHPGRKE